MGLPKGSLGYNGKENKGKVRRFYYWRFFRRLGRGLLLVVGLDDLLLIHALLKRCRR